MAISALHGLGMLLFGAMLVGMVDNWIVQAFGWLLIISGGCIAWVRRAQLRDENLSD